MCDINGFNPAPPKEGRCGHPTWEVSDPEGMGQLMRDQVDEIWVPSTTSASIYWQWNSGEKVVVVPNAIEPRQFPSAFVQPRWPQARGSVFVRRRLIRRKGIDLVVNAYAARFTVKDDACLVIKSFGNES